MDGVLPHRVAHHLTEQHTRLFEVLIRMAWPYPCHEAGDFVGRVPGVRVEGESVGAVVERVRLVVGQGT